jgi:hypothetical protein
VAQRPRSKKRTTSSACKFKNGCAS